LLQKVCGTLDHCFIITQRIHKEGDKHFCDFPRNKAPRRGPRHIWHIYTLGPFFGREKNTDGSAAGLKISLASVCYGDSRFAKHFLRPHLVFQPFWGWDDLGSFQLPQSHSSPEEAWNLGRLYLAPYEDNGTQLLSIASKYNGLCYLVSSVWLVQFQKPDASEAWTVCKR